MMIDKVILFLSGKRWLRRILMLVLIPIQLLLIVIVGFVELIKHINEIRKHDEESFVDSVTYEFQAWCSEVSDWIMYCAEFTRVLWTEKELVED